MKENKIHRLVSLIVLAGISLFPWMNLLAHGQDVRISSPVFSQTIPGGSAHRSLLSSKDVGEIDSSRMLQLSLMHKLSLEQKRDLDRLLAEQQTPGSIRYHQWLTAEDYGKRFGFSPSEIAQAETWLRNIGMQSIAASKSNSSISFSAQVSRVESGFATKIHAFAARGTEHYANVTEPAVPVSLATFVSAIHGLNDFGPEHQSTPSFVFPGSTLRGLAPDDLAIIYNIQTLYDSGLDGTGLSIGVIGEGEIDAKVVRQYRAQFNLSSNDVELMVVPGTSGNQDSSLSREAYLDVEVAGAVARNAHIIYIRSGNPDTALQYAIENNIAPILSYSFAGCGTESAMRSFYEALLNQANSQGITVLASSGDSGAAACDSPAAAVATKGLQVMAPASSPQVTAVGGTMFTDVSSTAYWAAGNHSHGGDALSYIPETGWNEGSSLYASGGGKSAEYSKPAWQTGGNFSSDGQRDIPDLAMSASLTAPYLVCVDLNCDVSLQGVAGTSASTPVVAGIVALLNQQLIQQKAIANAGLGNINPHLYLMAVKAPSAFHDITAGSNIVPCTIGTPDCTTGHLGYSAGPGYDRVTGLGSIDAGKLVTLWTSAEPVVSTVAVSSSLSQLNAGDSVLLTAIVSTEDGSIPTGNVTFLATKEGLAPQVLGAGAIGALGAATLSTSLLANGMNAITADYEGDLYRASSVSNNPVVITVQRFATSLIFSLSPSQIECGSPVTVSAGVTSTADMHTPTGLVSVMDGSTLLFSGSLDANGTLATTLSSLAEGSHTISVNYAGDRRFAPTVAVQAIAVTAQANAIPTMITFTATPTTVVSGSAVTMTAKVSAGSGAAIPTGNVNFSEGTMAVLDASGSATAVVSLSSSSAVQLKLSATYEGSRGLRSSLSNTIVLTLLPALAQVGTTTLLAASTLSVQMGDDLVFVARVSSNDASIPAGTVVLTNGSTGILDATGVAAIVVHAGSSLTVGSNSIAASYSGSAANLPSKSLPVLVALLGPDFTLTGPATLTVLQGATSNVSFTVTPMNGFTGMVSVECNGQSVNCTLSQSSVDVSGGAGKVSATITSGAGTSLIFGFLTLLGLSRRKRILAVLALTMICVGWMGGCGSNSVTKTAVLSPQTPHLSVLFVTATANGISHTTSIAITQE